MDIESEKNMHMIIMFKFSSSTRKNIDIFRGLMSCRLSNLPTANLRRIMMILLKRAIWWW
jgi:hypothetical protein